MTLNIQTVHARPDGVHVVNLGIEGETIVRLDPETGDPNAASLFSWLKVDGNGASSWPRGLEELKAQALAVARQAASSYRHQIAEHVPEDRAIAWVLKAAFGSLWALHEQNPTLADSILVNAAQEGYGIEAGITGEVAVDLRDRALAKSILFFKTTQVVEGMERLAEMRIPAATTPEELETVIGELRVQEQAAVAQLATLAQ